MPPPRRVVEHAQREPAVVVAGKRRATEHQVGLLGVLVLHAEPAPAQPGRATAVGAATWQRHVRLAPPVGEGLLDQPYHHRVVQVAGRGDHHRGGRVPPLVEV